MRKIFVVLKHLLKEFFINPFWRSWPIVIPVVFSLIINGVLWYIFELKIKDNSLPFIFSSGIIGLNFILSNYLFNKDKLSSYLLIYVALFIQILMLVFIKYLTVVF